MLISGRYLLSPISWRTNWRIFRISLTEKKRIIGGHNSAGNSIRVNGSRSTRLVFHSILSLSCCSNYFREGAVKCVVARGIRRHVAVPAPRLARGHKHFAARAPTLRSQVKSLEQPHHRKLHCIFSWIQIFHQGSFKFNKIVSIQKKPFMRGVSVERPRTATWAIKIGGKTK